MLWPGRATPPAAGGGCGRPPRRPQERASVAAEVAREDAGVAGAVGTVAAGQGAVLGTHGDRSVDRGPVGSVRAGDAPPVVRTIGPGVLGLDLAVVLERVGVEVVRDGTALEVVVARGEHGTADGRPDERG